MLILDSYRLRLIGVWNLSKIKTKQYNYQHLNQKYENYPQRYGEPAIDNWEEIQKKRIDHSHVTRIGTVGDVIDYRKAKHINEKKADDDLEEWGGAFQNELEEYEEYERIRKDKMSKFNKIGME